MWKNTRKVFYKMRAARNNCSKGNIDRSKCALAATHNIYVYILRSKCGKTPEELSTKCVPLVIIARKGISIVASVLWPQHTTYMCIFFVLNVEKTPEMFSIKRVRFVILVRMGISIVASVLWQQHKIFNNYSSSPNGL